MSLADTGPQVAFTFPESTLWKNERRTTPLWVALLHCGLQNIGATYSEPRSLAEIPLRATLTPILAQFRHMIEPLVILKGEAALPATV